MVYYLEAKLRGTIWGVQFIYNIPLGPKRLAYSQVTTGKPYIFLKIRRGVCEVILIYTNKKKMGLNMDKIMILKFIQLKIQFRIGLFKRDFYLVAID